VKKQYFVSTNHYDDGIVFEDIGDAIQFLRLSMKGKQATVQGYSDNERIEEKSGSKKYALRIFEESEPAKEPAKELAEIPASPPVKDEVSF
jgi:hypothetical protein